MVMCRAVAAGGERATHATKLCFTPRPRRRRACLCRSQAGPSCRRQLKSVAAAAEAGETKGAKKSEVPPGPQPTNIGRQTCCQTAHWQPVRAEIGADDFLSSVPRTSSAVICHVRRPLPATAPPITISPNSCAPNRADHVTPLNRSTGCALDRSTGSAH